MRPGMLAGFVAVVASVSACAVSTSDLEGVVDDLPGVARVVASEVEGDDAFPGEIIPKTVSVMMVCDATASQVRAVFDAYRELDDKYLNDVTVHLRGPKHTSLLAVPFRRVSGAVAAELVGAQSDPNVRRYERTLGVDDEDLRIQLVPLEVSSLLRLVVDYRRAHPRGYVDVTSGGSGFGWDPSDADPGLLERRIAFVERLNREFELTGLHLWGGGPLDLLVDPAEAGRLAAFAEAEADGGRLGKIVVNPKPIWQAEVEPMHKQDDCGLLDK